MGILNDLARFLGVILLGMRDSNKVFSENLEMAERYVRWGSERGDARDFQSALKHCDDCRDEDAPKDDLIMRKYATLFEAVIGIMHTNTANFRKHSEEALAERKSLQDEVESVRKSVQGGQDMVHKMQDDGNMLKAQAEMRHIEEQQRSLSRLEESAVQSDPLRKLADDYRQFMDEHVRLRTRLEMSLATLQQFEEVNSDSRNRLIQSVQASLHNAEAEASSLAPEGAPPILNDVEGGQ